MPKDTTTSTSSSAKPSPSPRKSKPYTHPRTKRTLWEENPDTDITLISVDGISFHCPKYKLQAFSETYKDLLSIPSSDVTINVEETGWELHQILHLFKTLKVDRTIEPELIESTKHSTRQEYFSKVTRLYKVIQKLQAELVLENYIKYLYQLLGGWKDSIAFPCFVIACELKEVELAKKSIRHFGELENNQPVEWTVEEVEEVGVPVFMNYMKAFEEGCVVSRDRDEIQWDVISRSFELPART